MKFGRSDGECRVDPSFERPAECGPLAGAPLRDATWAVTLLFDSVLTHWMVEIITLREKVWDITK